jgi:hypothetical protein
MNSIQAWTISDQSILRTKIQGFKFHLLHKLGLSLPNEAYRPMGSSIALHFFSFTKLASPYPQHRSAHVGMTVFWNFCATHLETVSIQSTLVAHQIPCHTKKKTHLSMDNISGTHVYCRNDNASKLYQSLAISFNHHTQSIGT